MEKTFETQLAALSDQELVNAFNREVRNPGWVSLRGVYLQVLRRELQKRNFDSSAVMHSLGLKLNRKVRLEDGKLVFCEESE